MLRVFGYVIAVLGLCVGCTRVDYDAAPVGRFSGSVLLLWVGEGSNTSGDGRFIFVPTPNRPLTFHRGGDGGSFPTITPGMIYTDGGSIPKPAQLFNGFSPWGYAPAYMVHDWLFVAKRCHTDGMADANEAQVSNMSFIESAEVIAEAIKTLIAERRVSENDVAPAVISGTVASNISKSKWELQGACATDRISKAHQKEVDDVLRRFGPTAKRRAGQHPLRSGTRIIAEISFD